jgi:hypothetical protein
MRRTHLVLSLVLLLASCVGCSGPTAPETQVSLSVESRSSCRFFHHMILSGRVLNTGGTPVWYTEGCGAETGLQVRLFDPDGVEVAFRDPSVVPACPDQGLPLAPGKEVRGEVVFDGSIYVAVPGGYERRQAPEGLYTVRIEFRFAGSATSAPMTATRSATFVWSNAVTCGA